MATSSLFVADPKKEEVSKLSEIKRLILDVLKPHNPSIVEVSKQLSELKGISGVNCMLEEVDKETDSLKITIEGTDINYDEVEKTLESLGAVIHSIDCVSAGKQIVDAVETLQDR
jgi:hypothetical protein